MRAWLVLLLGLAAGSASAGPTGITIGSKSFTESYVLAEIAAQAIERAGEVRVERRLGLGQTGIAFEALRNGKIDLYPEYTGTIAEAILKNPSLRDYGEIQRALSERGLLMGPPLGFNNTYALAVRKQTAIEARLATISDLGTRPKLRAGLSHEFLTREDCYPRLGSVYGLAFPNLRGMAHGLAYEALESAQIDLTDIYSTDAKVFKYDLVVLKDDRDAFPRYDAVLLFRKDFPSRFPKAWKALQSLAGRFSEAEMIRLNGRAELSHESFSSIAARFLSGSNAGPGTTSLGELPVLAWQHLVLVFVSLFFSTIVGVPLAILGSRSRALGQAILILTGLVQTIPSLALLCFLIPLFGIGIKPAIVALFLYGLLPIVRNTYLGLTSVDPRLGEVARALGLGPRQRLLRIELPLAMPSIMSGTKTSAIIAVGTATLAALIGAGGFGVPIVTGLALNDVPTILRGAVPAALLALGVHGVFELLERALVPRGLRLR